MLPGENAADRYVVRWVCDGLFADIERIHDLLAVMWEDYFSAAKNDLCERDIEVVGDTLLTLNNALYCVLLKYAVAVGDKRFNGVGQLMAAAKATEQAIECDDLADKACGPLRAARNAEEREEERAKVDAIKAMPDADAIPLFKALIKRGGDAG